jgi:hypothetical protein
MHTRHAIAALIFGTTVVIPFASTTARAQDSFAASVAASQASLAASGLIVEGSAGVIRAGSELIVAGIRPLADASVIVLRDMATGSEVSVRVAGDVVGAMMLVVGQSVFVVAEAAGFSLIAAGKLVAFIPNEVGQTLLYQARSTQHWSR